MRHALVWVAVATCSCGCASQNSFVQQRAASDMRCPETEVSVEQVVEEGSRHHYMARCGQEFRAYDCGGFGAMSDCNTDEFLEKKESKTREERRIATDPNAACVIGGIDPTTGTGSADIEGGNACLAECNANYSTCVASTPPMTSQRLACIDQRQRCGAACVQMANSYRGRSIPCDQACKAHTCEDICACSLRGHEGVNGR